MDSPCQYSEIPQIDVQIATQHLLDHIEWDLLSPLTPEAFASTLCSDLGLSGESAPLIAHAVHEEILRHKRDAIEWSVIGAGDVVAVDPEEEKDKDKPRDRSGMGLVKDKTGLGIGIGFGKRGEGKGPRPLKGVFRDWSEMEEWGTKLEELSAEEVERREIERERAARYVLCFTVDSRVRKILTYYLRQAFTQRNIEVSDNSEAATVTA